MRKLIIALALSMSGQLYCQVVEYRMVCDTSKMNPYIRKCMGNIDSSETEPVRESEIKICVLTGKLNFCEMMDVLIFRDSNGNETDCIPCNKAKLEEHIKICNND